MLTRRELDRLSNRVAHSIDGADTSPVIVLCEDEAEFLVAKLGVLKSGRPLIPMHPTEPASRMSLIVEVSRANTIILSHGQAVPAALEIGHVVRMDGLSGEDTAPEVELRPDDVAFLTFTSGSTGSPKAVVHSHRTLVARSESFGRALGMVAADTVILLSRESDLDFMAAMILGACACPFDIRVRGIVDLPEWLRHERVTVLRSTPSVLRVVMALHDGRPFPALRVVVSAGELLTPGDLERLRATFGPEVALVNLYGSAEAGVVTTQRLDEVDLATELLPVGTPVPDVEITLVDSTGAPVAKGEAGVVVVTSPNLAIGYLANDDLNALRFGGAGSERWFFSGDLGRFDEQGRLLFLGRNDDLVKVRGHRIELGEIESALRRVPGVTEGVVVARQGVEGATTLVGYYSTVDSRPLDVRVVREGLGRLLPAHMIPSAFVQVDTFPIGGIGKIDRSALPPPQRPTGAAPIGTADVENRMTRLWCEVLGVSGVSMGDSFFDLGGDSLAAVALMAAVEQEFGCRVPMVDLFEYETLEYMCSAVEQAGSSAPSGPLVPIRRTGDLPPLYCVNLPGWPEALYWSLAHHLDGRRPVIAVSEDLSVEAPPEDTLTGIAERYARAIRDDSAAPYHLLGSSAGGVLAHEIARVLEGRGSTIGFVGIIDSGYPGVRPGFRRRVGLLVRRGQNAVWRYGIRGVLALAVARSWGAEAPRHRVRAQLLATYDRHRLRPLTAPVTYFRAAGEREVPASLAAWRGEGATIVDVPGRHTGKGSILTEQHAPALARAVEGAIDAASRVPTGQGERSATGGPGSPVPQA